MMYMMHTTELVTRGMLINEGLDASATCMGWAVSLKRLDLVQASLIQSGLILSSALLLWAFRSEDTGGYGAAF